MEISQLKGFCAVVEEGSFIKAARKVFVSQPAITLQVKSLEEELEALLLIRDRKRVRTTDAGRALYQHAKRVLEELKSAEQEITGIQGLIKGHLTIGCSDTVSMYALNAIFASFIREYPQIEITVRNKTTSEIHQLLIAHNVDIGVTLLTDPIPNLHCEGFLTYHEVAVCSTHHPLARKKSVHLEILNNYKLLVLEEGTQTRTLLDQDFRQHGIAPSSIMEVGSVNVQKAFAAIDMGIAIVPDFAVEREQKIDSLAAVLIEEIPKRTLVILVKNKSAMTPAAKAFYEQLTKKARINK